MKKIILSIALLCAVVALQAQKLKGDLSCLSGQAKINVVFVYDGVTYDGDSEDEFFKNNSDRDDFATWKKQWTSTFRTSSWEPEYISECNNELSKKSLKIGKYADAAYTATVKVTDIDPGSFAGPFSQPAKINCTVSFTKKGENTAFATIQFKDFPGNPYQMTPVIEDRVKFAFNEVGQAFGKILGKKIK
ncbi:MAG: hypothetical protein MJZ76_03025 [Bacteroidales bacterium]|nr:hypothetical protein [Bacteroidales bacterium]